MRWDALFADMSAQLAAGEAAEQQAEIADRSRREIAALDLLARCTAHLGARLRIGVCGVGPLDGWLSDIAAQWLLLEEFPGRQSLVPMQAVLWIEGLGRAAARADPGVSRRLGLGPALRTLAGRRVPVSVHLSDGSHFTGTLDRVGADHVDLAEHPTDLARRAADVRTVRTLPMSAVTLVRPA
jgi:hypothetical protein